MTRPLFPLSPPALRAVLAVLFLFLAAAGPAGAQQSDQALLYEQLDRIMAREEPLAEEDIRLYMDNAEAIYQLRFAPENMEAVAASISGWTPGRFAYVTTKVAVGMAQALRPDDQRGLNVPEFAKPSPPESAIIRRFQDELLRTMERLQTRPSAP